MDWRIEREVRLEDFIAFVQYVRANAVQSSGNGFQFFVLFIMFLLLQLSFLVFRLEFDMASSFATMFAIMLWIFILSKHQANSMMPDERGLVLGRKELRLLDEGIEERSDVHASFFKWTAIRDIGNVKDHLFLMVDRNSGLILPKRCFADEREVERFIHEVMKRLPKSQDFAH